MYLCYKFYTCYVFASQSLIYQIKPLSEKEMHALKKKSFKKSFTNTTVKKFDSFELPMRKQ